MRRNAWELFKEGKMNSKKLLTAGMAALMGLSMIGCSSSKGSTAASGSAATSAGGVEKVELTVWGPQEDQNEDTGNWLKTECEKFAEANKDKWDITFTYGVCSEGDAKTLVGQDPTAAADVYMFANDQIPDLVAQNAIAELGGSALENVKSLNSDTTVKAMTYEGSVYGVPFSDNTWFMYYDKSVYSEEDVKSFETLLEKGKVCFPVSNSWYIAAFYVANGCTLFGEDGSDESAGIDFSGDKAVAVTNYLVDVCANPNFLDDQTAGLSNLGGEVSAYFSGDWDYATAAEKLGDNLGIAALPTITIDGKEGQMKAFLGVKAIGVNPNCKNQAAAVALASWLGGEEAQYDHLDMRGVIPTIATITTDNAAYKAAIEGKGEASAKSTIIQPVYASMGQYWGPAGSMGEELVKGSVTHDNAAEKTEAMNEAMNTATVQ